MWGLGDPESGQKHYRWATEIKIRCKVRKIPLFGVKSHIKKKRPGTDFVSIPGSFMVAEAGLEPTTSGL